MSPDPDQQAVIDIAHGRHLVLAPPGCGKTFILAQRVIQARAHGVDYADMLCLTFTNRASRAMRERISLHTHNPVPTDLFVGNVHRFCSNYLFDQKKIPQNSAVIDDLDSESIITHLAHLDPTQDQSHYCADIVNLQHALSQQAAGMPRKLIVHADLLDRLSDPHWQRKAQVAQQYAQYKETDNLLDFEDLLEKAYLCALGDPDRRRYSWIQVDEVQDLNFLQFAIIDLFSAPGATTLYLGDEQQAIFSFVGAKLDALEELKAQCHSNLHHLGRNHRSPRYLLDIFNTYATSQLDIQPSLLPTTADTSTPQPHDCCTFRACFHNLSHLYRKDHLRCPADGASCALCQRSVADEYRLAVALAKRYATLDPSGRVAIIVPTNANADRLSLEFGDTPHFKISGRDLFSTPAVQLLFSHLNIIANETCFIAWARLLHHLHVIPQYAAARNLMRQLRNCAVTPTDLLIYDNGGTYLQHFVQTIDTQEVVLFDTETTGLDIFNDDIIQIAAIKVRQGRYVEGSDFNIIIETTKEIPPLVGGHDNPMLTVYLNSERVSRREGLTHFLDYCQGHILIGHNVEFDYNILVHNLRRALGIELGHRQRFDTLKLARLVEPRLRVYKLEKLLETLHLEGTNSHNAIDDVRATLSLLAYCRRQADRYIPSQRRLLNSDGMRTLALRFQQAYGHLYLHSSQRLTDPHPAATDPKALPAIVDELQYLYRHLLADGVIQPIDKWQHIADFLATDIVDTTLAPTFRQQLDLYLTEINTVRESDLCDSTSMLRHGTERFFIATAHKAKGLEFDSVIIFNATEGAYPYFRNLRNNDQYHIREDARRFYVAISRARKHLCFTYSARGPDGTPSRPTPFLRPIAHRLAHFGFDPDRGKTGPIGGSPTL